MVACIGTPSVVMRDRGLNSAHCGGRARVTAGNEPAVSTASTARANRAGVTIAAIPRRGRIRDRPRLAVGYSTTLPLLGYSGATALCRVNGVLHVRSGRQASLSSVDANPLPARPIPEGGL